MSHPEQFAFVSLVAAANRELIADGRVIEIGSYDVNGSVRDLFGAAREYVGVDLTEGPGVDIVNFGHKVDEPTSSFEVAISAECFEHDPHWRDTFLNMCRLVRPGGLVAFTCASRGRPEHGTTRSDIKKSPGTQSRGIDYYRNLVEADFSEIRLDDLFTEFQFWYMPTSFDLYFAGVRSGPSVATAVAHLPQDSDVRAIRRVTTLRRKLVFSPLRIVSSVYAGKHYQDFAVPFSQLAARGALFRRAVMAGLGGSS